MITFLGILVSEDVDDKTLKTIGEEFNYQIKTIKNVIIEKKVGTPIVRFFHADRTGPCVKDISIGAYRIYYRDDSDLFDSSNISKCGIEFIRSLYGEVQSQKQEMTKDANNWLNAIKMLKYENHVKELGIFWTDDDYIVDPTDIEIFELDYVECLEEELTAEYLIKIPIDTLVMFV